MQFPDKKVTWLLAIPISDKERKYAETEGGEKLEELFESENVDFYDLNRQSLL